jgi:hypothetical protein
MLDQYRRDFADFNVATAREHYLFHSGQKSTLEISEIYERFSHLFDREMLTTFKRQLEGLLTDSGTESASVGRLYAFAVEQFLEDSVKQLTEEISQYEAAASVEWLGREMTFQDATVAITTEGDREERRGLHRRRLGVIESSNGLRAERLSKLYGASRSLEYSSYAELFEQIRGLDYSALTSLVTTIISRTEVKYLARLDFALKRDLGIGVEQAERSDAMYFLHLTGFDDGFPPEQMVRVYSETMAGLGIKIDAQNNITIDSEPRHRKNPRAFCTPISIPEDIKLVIRPSGGQSDYQSFLHESGHAQHYGWASTNLLPEFKYSGDYALTETYAFLFNHLISDSEWLANFLGIKDSREFVRSVMLAKLVTVRRYVAKLTFEERIHRTGNIADAAQLYSNLQTQSTSFKTYPGEYLFDLDDSFYSASYLRAWAFEVSLREYLKMRFGSRWWGSLRAGDFLKQIWETGDTYTADEMASQIGIGPIQFDPLIDEFNAALT